MNVAIISEYNPFHSGHLYHIEKIRETFGKDTNIIALMSGNFTQRGEPAFAEKYLRAEWAALAGINLVLELPFPYSIASAEIFSDAAISIIDSIGVVDCISFGSETGDFKKLKTIAENMLSEAFITAHKALLEDKSKKSLGYAGSIETAYKAVFGDSIERDFFSPNNILSIEYIKSIIRRKSPLGIHTVKRDGTHYNSTAIEKNAHPSASAVRKAIRENHGSASYYIPKSALLSFFDALRENKFPSVPEKLDTAVIASLRIGTTKYSGEIFDAGDGLLHRIKKASFSAESIDELVKITETKKYTNARIRRAIWYSFFGVTSSEIKCAPGFTQVLAMDNIGRSLLRDIKRNSNFPIITKPSSYGELSEDAVRQKKLLDTADSIYQLTLPCHAHGNSSVMAKPYLKL